MEQDGIHELTAAYALDALDEADERAYEEHLPGCPRCREELASLQETVGSLALGVEAPAPPPALRERILDQIRAERGTVVPIRRRWSLPVAGGLAAAAATAAIAVGIWAASVSSDLSSEREARQEIERVANLMAEPDAQRIPVSSGDGTLVVTPTGSAVLVLAGLDPPPEGKTYEVWVWLDPNDAPDPAGLFEPVGETTLVALDRSVPRGASVAVTVEPDGGSAQPTGEPLFTAETA